MQTYSTGTAARCSQLFTCTGLFLIWVTRLYWRNVEGKIYQMPNCKGGCNWRVKEKQKQCKRMWNRQSGELTEGCSAWSDILHSANGVQCLCRIAASGNNFRQIHENYFRKKSGTERRIPRENDAIDSRFMHDYNFNRSPLFFSIILTVARQSGWVRAAAAVLTLHAFFWLFSAYQ